MTSKRLHRSPSRRRRELHGAYLLAVVVVLGIAWWRTADETLGVGILPG